MTRGFLIPVIFVLYASVQTGYTQTASVIRRDSLLDAKILSLSSLHRTYNSTARFGPCGGFYVPSKLLQKKQKGLQVDTIVLNTAVTDTGSSGNIMKCKSPATPGQQEKIIEARVISIKSIFPETVALPPKTFSCGSFNYRHVSGKIKNSDLTPIPFASITIPGTKIGFIADSLGNYQIKLPARYKMLAFSSVGYKPETIKLEASHSGEKVDVVLRTSSPVCSEVVIVSSSCVIRKTVICCGGWRSNCKIHKSVVPGIQGNKNVDVANLHVYPNPVRHGSTVTIRINNTGNYQLQLMDNAGRIIDRKEFSIQVKNTLHTYGLPSSVAVGVHYIVVRDNDSDKNYVQKLIIQ